MLFPEDQIWIIVVGFIIAFILAFGIGANDVANSFGTSVGSRVLTLRQACILATIFETLGAVLIGAKVSDTIRKGILLPDVYQNSNFTNGAQIMMLGQLSSLSGACIWLLIATFFKLPVSGSHSIVGAIIGFALIAQGVRGINWIKLALIVSSWFISPLLSGIVSVLSFLIVDRFILKKEDALEPGLTFLPYIYMIAIVINVFSIFISGPPLLGFNKIPLYGIFIISFGVAIITFLTIRFLMVPFLRKRISERCKPENFLEIMNENIITLKVTDGNASGYVEQAILHLPIKKVVTIKDRPEQDALFSWIQILTAIFGAFAHGGNDVSNAIGPLIGLWIIGLTQDISSEMGTPMWILLYGGFGISVGLWVWGRRVIKTMGEDLTTITPSSGVCIEIGSALTVLLASNAGIPISTTHCKVGSIVAVGRYRAKDNVDWSIFRNVVIAWVVTVPVSAGLSALLMCGLIRLV